MTWFHYTIALASNIESHSDKKVAVTEQKIVTATFMDSGSVLPTDGATSKEAAAAELEGEP